MNDAVVRSDRPQHFTKTEFIVRQLRDEIVNGVLLPETMLMVDVLADRFDVSAIPVREALRTLEAENLVVLRPHRTAVVADLPIDELDDIYGVRMIIEGEAVRIATPQLTAATMTELEALVRSRRRHRNEAEGSAKHRRFHFAIYEAAGSPTLLDVISRLWDRTERCRMVLRQTSPRRTEQIGTHHSELLEVLATGDADKAAATMREHIGESLHYLHRLPDRAKSSLAAPAGQTALRSRRATL